jgi:hypothetical protein
VRTAVANLPFQLSDALARAVQPGAPGRADCGYQDLTDRAVLDLPAELGGVEVLGLLSRQSQVGVLPRR